MKKIKILSMVLLGSCLIAATSCKKYLDVNNNPNSPIDVTPDLILPAALAQTAANGVAFNTYGAWVGGYQANAGGYGGFGSDLTYNYSTQDYTGLWSSSFSNLNDYQIIINKTDATGIYKNYNAISKIMKAYCYLRLIDVYNDVPYSDALKGLNTLTPKYDKAEDIYRGLFKEINEGIASLALPNNSKSTIGTLSSPNSNRIDILYGAGEKADGSQDVVSFETSNYPNAKWVEFANTIKLKMLVRIREVSSLATTFAEEKAKLAGAKFISYDVKTQPGYAAQSGKQNPAWNSYAYTATGGAAMADKIPAWYAVGFYDGTKLLDEIRGKAITYSSLTIANQLGITDAFVPRTPSNSVVWYVGSTAGTAGDALGILKGPTAAMPLMLSAESYFLQAEANLFGIITTGNAETNFYMGIDQSFKYLYTRQNEAISTDHFGIIKYGLDDSDVGYYRDGDNPTSPLVNFALAGSIDQKLEAIITQKWIAENYIQSNEGWSDYRRTGYPKVVPGSKYSTPASVQSVSTRIDKLPVRVLYPSTEYALNPTNVPSGINAFTSRVFYDLN